MSALKLKMVLVFPFIRVQLLRSCGNRLIIVSYSCSILSGLLGLKRRGAQG